MLPMHHFATHRPPTQVELMIIPKNVHPHPHPLTSCLNFFSHFRILLPFSFPISSRLVLFLDGREVAFRVAETNNLGTRLLRGRRAEEWVQVLTRVLVGRSDEEERMEALVYHCYRGLLTPDTRIHLKATGPSRHSLMSCCWWMGGPPGCVWHWSLRFFRKPREVSLQIEGGSE